MSQFVLTSSNCIYEYGTEKDSVCTFDDDRLYVSSTTTYDQLTTLYNII